MTLKNFFFGFLIFIALLAFLNQDYLFNQLPNKILGPDYIKNDTLTITLNTPATNLSEYSLNLNNLLRTANIYEGLVAFDRNLKTIPALAVSWGNLNPTTWEFKLRQGVVFHDGMPFTTGSVVNSFESAKISGSSQIQGILDTIKEIKAIDPFTLQIVTHQPDPLILSKLTKFFISHPGRIGTGPYTIQDWKKGSELILDAFTDYWGKLPKYKNVVYKVVQDKNKRKTDFNEGKIDILVAVPRDQALTLQKDQVKTSFSLEVNFLMFKIDDPLLSEKNLRETISTIFDPKEIEEIGNGFVRQVSQFVAPGVFGYNPSIPLFKFDEEKRAKSIFGEQRKKITMDFLSTYRTLAQYMERQLADAGFLVTANAVSPEELLTRIKNNTSQMFVIGWQSENGDAGDFLDAFIHSKGEFNNGRYKNAFVDALIEKSRQQLNPGERLKTLQTIMSLVDKDIMGIPLFESSRLYAVRKGIKWDPRLDGLVLARDVR